MMVFDEDGVGDGFEPRRARVSWASEVYVGWMLLGWMSAYNWVVAVKAVAWPPMDGSVACRLKGGWPAVQARCPGAALQRSS